MIFQPFAATAAIERNQHQTMLVVCPLQTISVDQITEARRMGMSAALIADISDHWGVKVGPKKQHGHSSAYATIKSFQNILHQFHILW